MLERATDLDLKVKTVSECHHGWVSFVSLSPPQITDINRARLAWYVRMLRAISPTSGSYASVYHLYIPHDNDIYQAHALETMSIDDRWFQVNITSPGETHEIIDVNKAR
jgi:hypothetical protein